LPSRWSCCDAFSGQRHRARYVFSLSRGDIRPYDDDSSADTDLDTDDIAEDEALYLDPERRRGYNTDMSAIPAPQRIELSPGVRAILEVDTPKSQLLRHFLHFTEAILAPGPGWD
jgi:hypothetical protein